MRTESPGSEAVYAMQRQEELLPQEHPRTPGQVYVSTRYVNEWRKREPLDSTHSENIFSPVDRSHSGPQPLCHKRHNFQYVLARSGSLPGSTFRRTELPNFCESTDSQPSLIFLLNL